MAVEAIIVTPPVIVVPAISVILGILFTVLLNKQLTGAIKLMSPVSVPIPPAKD